MDNSANVRAWITSIYNDNDDPYDDDVHNDDTEDESTTTTEIGMHNEDDFFGIQ